MDMAKARGSVEAITELNRLFGTVITQLDQTDLMEYITEHKKTLEKKDIKWYAFRCKNKRKAN